MVHVPLSPDRAGLKANTSAEDVCLTSREVMEERRLAAERLQKAHPDMNVIIDHSGPKSRSIGAQGGEPRLPPALQHEVDQANAGSHGCDGGAIKMMPKRGGPGF